MTTLLVVFCQLCIGLKCKKIGLEKLTTSLLENWLALPLTNLHTLSSG